MVIGNRKAFCPIPQTTPKTPVQPSTTGAGQTVMPVVTAVTSISTAPMMSLTTPPMTSWGSTSHSVNLSRSPPWTKCQAAVSQGGRLRANRPFTSQAVVYLLDLLDEVTEEVQCEESMEEASIMEVHEIIEEFQESPNG